MSDNKKHLLCLVVVSLLTGILGTLAVYRYFPQYLCYTVRDAYTSDLYESREQTLGSGLEYTEIFVPRESYVMSIIIRLTGTAEQSQKVITGKLINEEGKVIGSSKTLIGRVENSVFCEIPIGKWLKPGERYRLAIVFPEEEELAVTMGPGDIGPDEHIGAEIDGEPAENSLYLQYVYGSYSKKLLGVWFLVFCLSGYLLGECFLFRTGSRRK